MESETNRINYHRRQTAKPKVWKEKNPRLSFLIEGKTHKLGEMICPRAVNSRGMLYFSFDFITSKRSCVSECGAGVERTNATDKMLERKEFLLCSGMI